MHNQFLRRFVERQGGTIATLYHCFRITHLSRTLAVPIASLAVKPVRQAVELAAALAITRR